MAVKIDWFPAPLRLEYARMISPAGFNVAEGVDGLDLKPDSDFAQPDVLELLAGSV